MSTEPNLPPSPPRPQPTSKPTCVLVLQGGGALGAYHIGAYQALEERDLLPDWVCGISIGAINAAIIAGNAPAARLARLAELWEVISRPDFFAPFGGGPFPWFSNVLSNTEALVFGQPNFFVPRPINPYFAPPGPQATSFYDTTPMLFTLRQFVDFDLIKAKATRLSLGATDISTGNLEFFHNTATEIGPEHVLASGSLPPGFPPTRVGQKLYWDGGCVSNTPLEAVLADQPPGHTVAFMIDLWSASGELPQTMNEVMWREKQIQYASRVTAHIDAVATKVNLQHAMGLMKNVAELADAVPDAAALNVGSRLDIVHLVYHPAADQIPASDAEFSRASIEARRQAGYRDMRRALDESPWFAQERPAHVGALVHRVENETVMTQALPRLRHTTGLRSPADVAAVAQPAGNKKRA